MILACISSFTQELFNRGSSGAVEEEYTTKDMIKAIKTVSQDMAFPSSNWNAYKKLNPDEDAVITWTPIENQILILRNDLAVEMDVEVLAQAFNVSYTDLKQRTLIVDSFGGLPEDMDSSLYGTCGAVLCDEAYFQVYDNLQQMENFRNGEGLYENFIYHHWQTYSLSLFANAVAFMLPPSAE